MLPNAANDMLSDIDSEIDQKADTPEPEPIDLTKVLPENDEGSNE
jgi:hypothetical protein